MYFFYCIYCIYFTPTLKLPLSGQERCDFLAITFIRKYISKKFQMEVINNIKICNDNSNSNSNFITVIVIIIIIIIIIIIMMITIIIIIITMIMILR